MDFIIGPYGLLLIAFLILFIGRYVFNKRYLNCFEIIQKHVKCFKKSNGAISWISIFLYFGLPILISIALLRIKTIDDDVINMLTVIVSILTSMFFTLLTLILDMRGRVRDNKSYDGGDADLSRKILKETYYSIMFEILVSVTILIMCFVELFAEKFNWLWSLSIYYLSFVMLTNMFMILKRIYKVIDKDIEKN